MTRTTIEATSGPAPAATQYSRRDAAREAIEVIAERDPALMREAVERLYVPDFHANGPAQDLCPKHALSLRPGDFAPFEDREVAIRQILESGDRVTAYLEFAGTHRGGLLRRAGRRSPDARRRHRGPAVRGRSDRAGVGGPAVALSGPGRSLSLHSDGRGRVGSSVMSR